MASKGGAGRTIATVVLTTRYIESLKRADEPYRVKDQLNSGA